MTFTATTVANLDVWLDASQGVTVATGVSAWADQSGNSHNASQGTGSAQPTLTSNVANGNPGILFGTGKSLSCTSSALTNATIFVAFKVNSGTSASYCALLNWSGGTGFTPDVLVHFFASDLYQPAVQYGTPVSLWYDPYFTSGLAHVQTLEINSSTKDLLAFVNGKASASNPVNNTGVVTTGTSFTIGNDGGFDPLSGYILEILIYRGILSTGDRQIVESYLGLKYALPTLSLAGTPSGLGSATLASALLVDPLGASVQGQGTLTGTETTGIWLPSAPSSGLGVLTGAASLVRPVSGVASGQGTAAATPSLGVLDLAGSPGGQATATGTVSLLVPLVAALSGQGTTTADVTSLVPLTEADGEGLGQAVGQLALQIALAGAVQGQSALTGTETTVVRHAGTVAGVGDAAADVLPAVPLGAALLGQGAVNGQETTLLSFAAETSGQGTTSAGSLAAVPLAAVTQGQGTTSGVETTALFLGAAAGGQASPVAGPLGAFVLLGAAVSGSAQATGTETTAVFLGPATAPGEGAATGQPSGGLHADAAGQATATGQVAAQLPVLAQAPGSSQASADLTTEKALPYSESVGQSVVLGALGNRALLVGAAIQGQGTASADVTRFGTHYAVTANVRASASANGVLALRRVLGARARSAASSGAGSALRKVGRLHGASVGTSSAALTLIKHGKVFCTASSVASSLSGAALHRRGHLGGTAAAQALAILPAGGVIRVLRGAIVGAPSSHLIALGYVYNLHGRTGGVASAASRVPGTRLDPSTLPRGLTQARINALSLQFTLGADPPELLATLESEDGPMDLSGCDVVLRWKDPSGHVEQRRCEILDPPVDGEVRYAFTQADLFRAGLYKAQFLVTRGQNVRVHVPNGQALGVRVRSEPLTAQAGW